MNGQPDWSERRLLIEIYREVGETKQAVSDLSEKVDDHIKADDVVHATLRRGVLESAKSEAAGRIKHRIAIGLGLAGVGSGGAAATEAGFLERILGIFTGG